jgi:DNA-binding transcriptional LysR family regulator
LVIVITQRRLQHALTVAEHGHFGRAATELHISQPALTRSIQALEAELGVRLFDRTKGRVMPTAFGEIVIRRGKALLSDHHDLLQEIKNLAGQRTEVLHIALGPHPGAISGFAAVGRLNARHPQIAVSSHVHNSWRDLIRDIVDGAAHVGIMELSRAVEDTRLHAERIGEHVGRFFCRPRHPILRRGSVSLADLFEFPWVSTRIPPRIAAAFPKALGRAGHYDRTGGDFMPAIEIDSLTQFVEMVAGTDALALVPLVIAENALAERRIVIVPVGDIEPKTQYAFIYLKDRPPNSAVVAYMREVRAVEAAVAKREKSLERKYPSVASDTREPAVPT